MSARGGKKKGAKKKKAPTWKCAWCPRTKGEQRRGPNGPNTLCGKCGRRYGKGETGPRSDDWSCGWCGADDSKTSMRCKDLCASCHGRRANGATGPAAENWRCDWCGTKEPGHARCAGPKGPGTLCVPCGLRFSRGATGPRSATFECRWCKATSTSRRCVGPTGEDELCDSCGVSYAMASDKIKARLVHVETELVRLTSVLAIDVDEDKETRIPRPKRSSEAPGGGGLKALKAATDETAGVIVEVKRERDEAQDRNECIVCMERPRAVLFRPCNHFVVCATCATDTCPFCNGAAASRITIANSS